jgi:hypothetical protein
MVPTYLERGSINYLVRGISKSHRRIVEGSAGELDLNNVRTTIRLMPRLAMGIPHPRNQRLIRSPARMTSPLSDGCQSGSSKVCPERKLAVAVLSQAADDLQKFRNARRQASSSLYADARKWIISNDRLWPFSFLNLCDALHLAADVIRAELLGKTSGHPSLNV